MGLGNPGPEYDETRHNAGFRLADHLVARWRLGPYTRAERARQAEGVWDGREVRVIKPQTYMNRSGAALAPLRDVSGFDPATHLLILSDDVALPVGRFRVRGAGSSGGHNGLKSIEAALQRQDYARLRIGVGLVPPEVEDLADFVLGPLEPEEQRMIAELLDPMAEAVECWMAEGVERAMSRFNR
ncbi:MAG TPA: aminoacyl-tRNA hydrolase [Gemmatimonadales bacterium]|nr:aminoacyl-tRNA hydrolase [Gemmatimonadales bacterium]